VKVSKLKRNPNNPRQISGDKLEKLKASVGGFQKMMELRPIVVDENFVVLGGNMRLAAIKALALKEIPDSWVKVAEGLTEDEKREFVIKDNVSGGEWDWDALANEWSDLPLTDWGLDLPGFEAIEAVEPSDAEPQIDKAAELNKKWQVKSGDLWQIGEHRLLCGDSTNPQHIDALLIGESVDLVYTDPPYGIDEVTDRAEHVKTFKKQGVAKKGQYEKIVGDTSIQTALDVWALLTALGCQRIIYWGGNYYAASLPNSACWIVWDKRVDENQHDINSDCELAYVKHPHKASVRIFRHLWKGMIKASEQGEARVHPTQKPIALAEWSITEYDPDGSTVLDLFGGSGSTMVAAQNKNRKARLCEISENYCAVILERMATAFPEFRDKADRECRKSHKLKR
jgi:DNA modification methylase